MSTRVATHEQIRALPVIPKNSIIHAPNKQSDQIKKISPPRTFAPQYFFLCFTEFHSPTYKNNAVFRHVSPIKLNETHYTYAFKKKIKKHKIKILIILYIGTFLATVRTNVDFCRRCNTLEASPPPPLPPSLHAVTIYISIYTAIHIGNRPAPNTKVFLLLRVPDCCCCWVWLSSSSSS